MKVEQTFEIFDPKKHSVRYHCVGEAKVLSDAYLLRAGLPQTAPRRVKITVEWEENEG